MRWSRRQFAGVLVVEAAGCARPPAASVAPPAAAESGQWIVGPYGAQLTAPAGAWTASEPLAIELPAIGSTPGLPAGVVSVGATYTLRPAGAKFEAPVTVAIPFDRTQVPPQANVALLSLPAASDTWTEVPGALLHGASVVAPVRESASFVVVVPLQPLS